MKTIRKPSVAEIERYLEKWRSHPNLRNYPIQERIIVSLFEQYPRNTKIEEVLHKVSILNDFYSTNIRDTFTVAEHIVKLNIDGQLRKEDLDIVDKMARVRIGGKERRFYSFATKYCSHHQPEVYPIYDRNVREVLTYFNNQDNFADFSKKVIKENYITFKQVILSFQKFYELEDYKLRDIDRYLFLLGKEKFPRTY
jgi:hypothetical protein